jgi:hypothetical protein
MEITRTGPETRRAPTEWFTGEVWLDQIAAAPSPSRLRAYSVHFTPGARTAWHQHPFGQVIHVTEGQGLVQRRGGPVERIRVGDTVRFESGRGSLARGRPDLVHVPPRTARDRRRRCRRPLGGTCHRRRVPAVAGRVVAGEFGLSIVRATFAIVDPAPSLRAATG